MPRTPSYQPVETDPAITSSTMERENDVQSIEAPVTPQRNTEFSTSICSLFQNPNSRSDCCALLCCGVLAGDRNLYLLTKQKPPTWNSWIKRLCLNIVFPLAVWKLGRIFVGVTAETNPLLAEWILISTVVLFFTIIACLMRRASLYRRETREAVLRKMYQTGSTYGDDRQGELNFLRQREREIESAHPCCCVSYPKVYDAPLALTDDVDDRDLCATSWSCARKMCGLCQCCGICAIGQESREIDRLFPRNERLVDYVTFESYQDYFPAIITLRSSLNDSIVAHWKATSILSQKLMGLLGIFIAFLFLVALTDFNATFTWKNLFVLLGTFGQAFLVLFLVHWKWHKFDISLDAVIKYFACGFLLTPGVVMVFELLIQFFSGIVFIIMFVIALSKSDETGSIPFMSKEEFERFIRTFLKEYDWIFILFFFVNSFLVAALVEETAKYFAYWSVEHPDFLESSSGLAPRRSLNSCGSAITIAMVAAATGFACCENLLYIFEYVPSNLQTEITTLLMRSLFPVHPLCAAIQSIGVCRRDLEGDKTWKLGRCLLPAIILHGSFDFYLMVSSFMKAMSSGDFQFQDDEFSDQGEIDSYSSAVDVILFIVVPFLFVLMGALYYYVSSRSQKSRLDALEALRLGTSEATSLNAVI